MRPPTSSGAQPYKPASLLPAPPIPPPLDDAWATPWQQCSAVSRCCLDSRLADSAVAGKPFHVTTRPVLASVRVTPTTASAFGAGRGRLRRFAVAPLLHPAHRLVE